MITKSIYIPAIKQELEFYIGENAQDNFDILDITKATDIWFHLHNESSCHVVAVIPVDSKFNRNQMSKIITQGALCCKQHSKAKSNKHVEICYTRVINVVKTYIIGQVIAKEQKIVII
jgi:predicted ribosome quality control (RQC) complex YloA/Tae2 family protein